MAITSGLHMSSDLVRRGHRGTGEGVRSRVTLALLFALFSWSACKGRGPEETKTDVSGASESVTVIPIGDTHIGPHDEFDPASLHTRYVIANETRQPLSWEVRVSKPWLSLADEASAVLAPGAAAEVTVDIDPYTASLEGTEPATAEVTFLESDTGVVLGRRSVTIESSFVAFGRGGWTTFERSADALQVFVSHSEGDDGNDGFSPATPKRTIAAGVALLRDGFPDWLLLRRGDAWQESLGQWKKSGRGLNEPMVVSTYGDALQRPLLLTGTQGGVWTHGGSGSSNAIDCLAIVGLHFRPDGYTGNGGCVGAQFLQPSSHLLIEDCKFVGYSTNVVFQGFEGRHRDFRLRRSVLVDAHNNHVTGEHSQGLYVHNVDGLLIEENVFDHNGWSKTVPGAHADMFSHNLYIANGNTGVQVRGNLIANGSSHGLQLRCGGSVVNNLFVQNSISLLVGGGTDPEPGGVRADVLGNVIVEGKDIDLSNPRGWGIVLSNISSGNVAYNVIAGNTLGSQPAALVLDGDATGDNGSTIGVHETSIVGNIVYNWGGGILVEGDAAQISGLEFTRNQLQDAVLSEPLFEHFDAGTTAAFRSSENCFFDQVVPTNAWAVIEHVPRSIAYWKAQVGDVTSTVERSSFAEPDRSLASYNVLIGGAYGLNAFLAEARLQSRTNWRLSYTAAQTNRYIRSGF